LALSGAAITTLKDLERDDFTDALPGSTSAVHSTTAVSLDKFKALWAGTSKGTLSAIAFGCVGVAAFYSALSLPSTEKPEVPPDLSTPAVSEAPPQKSADTLTVVDATANSAQQNPPLPELQPNTTSASPAEIVGVRYILDEYPEPIKISLLDTARGVTAEPAVVTERSEPEGPREPQRKSNGGNLFKLLESASTSQGDKPSEDSTSPQGAVDQGAPPSSWNEPSEEGDSDPNDEQQRREAIRQKFLEAIRAAAEKRQATLEGG
jgi:hypothetical protein